jgi:hypothetical protein
MGKATHFNLLFVLILFVILFQYANPSMLEIPIYDLVSDANLIIRGKVKSIECTWDSQHKFIYSYVKVGISNFIKGEVDEREVTIKHIGGVVGNLGLWVSAAPQFEKDEEIVVFLGEKDRSGNYDFRHYGWENLLFNPERLKSWNCQLKP